MKLTVTKIKQAKPQAKPFQITDGDGLSILVQPSGGKLWRFRYRWLGRQQMISLGSFPEISLAQARSLRSAAREQIANGVNPSAARQASKAAVHFEGVAREWFAKQSPSWADSHAKRVMQRLENDALPCIGQLVVAEIKPADLIAMARRVEERGAFHAAKRVLGICSQVLQYAVITDRADHNPAVGLTKALTNAPKTHFAALTEPEEFAGVLRAIDGYRGKNAIVYCALKLAPMVFVRPGELRAALWADIDLDKAEWRFTASKTKQEHIVPVARQAVEILVDFKRLTGGSDYVFPSARSWDRPMSDNAVLSALRRMGIGKEEMTGHGWRATARTLLDEELGFRPDLIEHQLAHSVRDANGRAYNRTKHLSQRRDMMQKWADYLEEIKVGKVV